jgi:hypothetical protein
MNCRKCTSQESAQIDNRELPPRTSYRVSVAGQQMTYIVESNDGWWDPGDATRRGRRRAAFREKKSYESLY